MKNTQTKNTKKLFENVGANAFKLNKMMENTPQPVDIENLTADDTGFTSGNLKDGTALTSQQLEQLATDYPELLSDVQNNPNGVRPEKYNAGKPIYLN